MVKPGETASTAMVSSPSARQPDHAGLRGRVVQALTMRGAGLGEVRWNRSLTPRSAKGLAELRREIKRARCLKNQNLAHRSRLQALSHVLVIACRPCTKVEKLWSARSFRVDVRGGRHLQRLACATRRSRRSGRDLARTFRG